MPDMMDPISAMFGRMQGLPQRPPPMFAGASNQPIRRLGMEQMQLLQPNFQGMGMGAMAGPASMGMQLLQQVIGKMTGMTMGPQGGSATSYMRSMQQQQDLQRLQTMSNKQDFGRVRQLVSAFTAAAYKGEDPNKVNALTTSVTEDYMKILNTGMGQAFGLEDYLAPGGLSSGFSQRMYMAGMRNRRGPGRMGLSVEETSDITKQLQGRMFQGGKEQFDFTRGFNMREFGEMATGMAQRGTLDFGADRGRMMNQFKGMAGALDALKDLMGTPDAPISKMMQTLDDMFGGAAIPATRMEGMVRRAQAMGKVMNLTGTQLQQVFRGATLQAQGLGMHGALGAISALRAMPVSEAAQQMAEARISGRADGDTRIRLGAMTPKQRMQTTQTAILRTANSRFGDKLATMMRLRRMRPGGLTGSEDLERMEIIAKKMESGQAVSAEEGGWLRRKMQRGGLEAEMTNAGFDAGTIRAVGLDRLSLDEEKANIDFTGATLSGFRDESAMKIGARLQGSRIFQQVLGLDKMENQGDRAQAAKAFVNKMLGGQVTPEALRARMSSDPALRAGIARAAADLNVSPEQIANMAQAQFTGAGRSVLDRSIVGDRGVEGLRDLTGDEAVVRRRELIQASRTDAMVNKSMAQAGFGQTRGGLGGMMNNFLRAVAEGGADADLGDIVGRTLGGVPSERLLEAFSNPEVVKEYTKMQTLTDKIKANVEAITKAEGKKKEKLIQTRGELEKELGLTREILGDYAILLKGGAAGTARRLSGAAAKMGAVAKSGTDVEVVSALESARGGVSHLQLMKEASVLGSAAEKRDYISAGGASKKLIEDALDSDDPTIRRDALMKLSAMTRNRQGKQKEVGESESGTQVAAVRAARTAEAARIADEAKKIAPAGEGEAEAREAVVPTTGSKTHPMSLEATTAGQVKFSLKGHIEMDQLSSGG